LTSISTHLNVCQRLQASFLQSCVLNGVVSS